MDVKFYPSDRLSDIKDDWKRLEQGQEMTAFQSFEWNLSLDRLYQSEKAKNLVRTWFYAVAEEDGKAVMIAPLQYFKMTLFGQQIGVKKGFYFIGGTGFTDYTNFIYDEFREEHAQAIFDAVTKRYHADHFCLEHIPQTASLCAYILERFGARTESYPCAALTLPPTFEDYKAMLSKSNRQNIRTALNRQARDGMDLKYTFEIERVDAQTAKAMLDIKKSRAKHLNAIARKQMSIKGRIYAAIFLPIKKLFSKKHDILAEPLEAWSFQVKNGDDLAGFFWGITDVSKTKMYVIFAGVKEGYSWYSPTISQFYRLVEELYREDTKITTFDFTRGAEKYKFDLGCTEKKNLRIYFNAK